MYTDPARIVGFRTAALGQGPGGYVYVVAPTVSLEEMRVNSMAGPYLMTACGGNITHCISIPSVLTRTQNFSRVTERLAYMLISEPGPGNKICRDIVDSCMSI